MAQGKIIDTRPSVLVTCTTQGSCRKEVVTGLLSVMKAGEKAYRMHISTLEGKPYASVMNSIVVRLLAEGYDWWLHTDSDQTWQQGRNPLASIKLMKDIVAFPAPIFRPGGCMDPGMLFGFNTFTLVKEGEPGYVDDGVRFRLASPWNGLQRVDMFATGSFLIRVAVLEKIKAVSQYDRENFDIGGRGPFSRAFDSDGIQTAGNDVEFSRRCRQAGVEMWANYDCVCHHWHELDMLGLMAATRDLVQQVVSEALKKVGGNGEAAMAASIVRP